MGREDTNGTNKQAPRKDYAAGELFQKILEVEGGEENLKRRSLAFLNSRGFRDDAEDIYQETVRKMLAPRTAYRKITGGFFYRSLGNMMIDFHRKTQKRRETVTGETDLGEAGHLYTKAGKVEESALTEIIEDEIDKALREQLIPEQADVFLLRKRGRGYREISNILGIPIGTVMSRLHRARDKLKKDIERGKEWAQPYLPARFA